MLYSLIKLIFFQFDPEKSSKFILNQLKKISGTPLESIIRQSLPIKYVNCMGIKFKNPLGIAAGFDKNGEYINILDTMGFGFIEVGTVTPRPQLGNEKPRLFRLTKVNGLINRMGFNNNGIDNLIENIKKSHFNGILGVNIGKNQNTTLEYSKDDYLICIDKIYTYASYIAINISSPNTIGLRKLQFGEIFDDLLKNIKSKQVCLCARYHKYVPIVIKISPDITETELIQIADSLIRYNIDGVIATNTTIERKLIVGIKNHTQYGGLSGRPLQLLSTNVIRLLSIELKNKLPIIGVGGIDSVVSAREKIAAGATLIQIYSGFVFHGLRLIKDIISSM